MKTLKNLKTEEVNVKKFKCRNKYKLNDMKSSDDSHPIWMHQLLNFKKMNI